MNSKAIKEAKRRKRILNLLVVLPLSAIILILYSDKREKSETIDEYREILGNMFYFHAEESYAKKKWYLEHCDTIADFVEKHHIDTTLILDCETCNCVVDTYRIDTLTAYLNHKTRFIRKRYEEQEKKSYYRLAIIPIILTIFIGFYQNRLEKKYKEEVSKIPGADKNEKKSDFS